MCPPPLPFGACYTKPNYYKLSVSESLCEHQRRNKSTITFGLITDTFLCSLEKNHVTYSTGNVEWKVKREWKLFTCGRRKEMPSELKRWGRIHGGPLHLSRIVKKGRSGDTLSLGCRKCSPRSLQRIAIIIWRPHCGRWWSI